MASDIFKDKFTITLDSEEFVFRIPSPMDYANIAIRARTLRMNASGLAGQSEAGLDPFTIDLFRGMAVLELLLDKADTKANWVFTSSNAGPVVDSSKFPPNKISVVAEVYRRFEEELANFLNRGPDSDASNSGETVAS